jgi:hypothetical protein
MTLWSGVRRPHAVVQFYICKEAITGQKKTLIGAVAPNEVGREAAIGIHLDQDSVLGRVVMHTVLDL